MNDLVLTLYEFLTILLPFLIVFLVLQHIYKCSGVSCPKWKFVKLIVFILYIFAVLYVTGSGTLYDLLRYGVQAGGGQLNLIPFSKNIDSVECFLNILLFLPFGFLLPFIWSHLCKLNYVVLSGLSFSLLIEISQLFNNRQTDIDDVILNTLGTVIGFILFRLFSCVTRRKDDSTACLKSEPVIYVLAIFLGHFLLFNAFGLVKILYGL